MSKKSRQTTTTVKSQPLFSSQNVLQPVLSSRFRDLFCSIFAMLLLCLLCAGAAYSQTTPPPNKTALSGWTPIAQQPGAPAGSYALSGFDNINLFNGHLNFRLPLMKVGGRGKAGYEMMLPIEQNWRVETVAVPHCDQSGCGYYESDYRYIANPIWWTGIRARFWTRGVAGSAKWRWGFRNEVAASLITRL